MPVCIAREYDLSDKDINAAVIELSGRYPDKGRVVNEKCKEIVYVIEGTGKLVIENEELLLEEGDMTMIRPGQKYFFEGNLRFLTPCTPAWHPEQHKMVK
ncbi:hypothetical protein A3D06_00850 [Candidatus Roizmanbacteria bacterium RIFCSPHIGHO2_02_FULL_40_9]|uniref:Cupin type-2 domain-containing protein n=1 Tax=Candidatus Roizmanbacteria bacterium RIFCSPHIGHO2_02_FULL_40_9 TaxID=1802042 RepID=A0A1F7HD96_9BACT|nr:MAG: hypothetical protein A3D06_00850 [Candidatus Roizmanbacteria bacterium RIFCSPHIGHO2_02_FULL_40_9]